MKNNTHDDHMASMMWMMAICCLSPFLFILFFGAGEKSVGIPSWLIIAGILIFAGVHFFLMRRQKGCNHNSKHEETEENPNQSEKDKK